MENVVKKKKKKTLNKQYKLVCDVNKIVEN